MLSICACNQKELEKERALCTELQVTKLIIIDYTIIFFWLLLKQLISVIEEVGFIAIDTKNSDHFEVECFQDELKDKSNCMYQQSSHYFDLTINHLFLKKSFSLFNPISGLLQYFHQYLFRATRLRFVHILPLSYQW